MASIIFSLDFDMVLNILSATGFKGRKNREGVTEEHYSRLKSRAVKVIQSWQENGVPPTEFSSLSASVIRKFKLREKTPDNQEPNDCSLTAGGSLSVKRITKKYFFTTLIIVLSLSSFLTNCDYIH